MPFFLRIESHREGTGRLDFTRTLVVEDAIEALMPAQAPRSSNGGLYLSLELTRSITESLTQRVEAIEISQKPT